VYACNCAIENSGFKVWRFRFGGLRFGVWGGRLEVGGLGQIAPGLG